LNSSGQLGTSDTVARQSPTQIPGSWLQISAGASHSVGLRSDYTLYTWGLGISGQLGQNDTPPPQINRSSPTQVGTNSWSQVSAGNNFTLALKNDKTLWVWGLNTSYQLGSGTTVSRSSPVQIGSSSWAQISAGGTHVLATDINSLLYGWGTQTFGQLGLGDTAFRSQPTQIGNSSYIAISAGYSHSIAVTSDNRLFTWGNNTNGQLGFNMSFISIGAGNSMTSVIRSDGTLWTWGLGTSGQLGDTTAATKSSPVTVGLLTNWKTTTRPSFTNYAIDNTGKLYAWGENSVGSIGDGTVVNKSSPVQIGNSSWTMIATSVTGTTGQQTAYAIRSDGALFIWGDNSYGQGINGNAPTISPTQLGSSSWSVVSAGLQFAMAITSNGKLFSWGRNDAGQLGVTPSTFSWTKISSSGLHTLAIRSDNRLFAWGLNTSGQLGLGDNIARSSPVQVTSGSYTQLSAGLSNSYAISSDGKLFAWGDNSQGQIPLISQARSNPVQIGAGSVYSVFFGGSATTDFYSVANNTAFSLSGGSYTIELWAYWNNTSGEQNIIERFTPASGPGYTLYKAGSNNIQLYGSGVVITSVTAVVTGVWYHIAISYDGTNTRIFINGALEASAVANITDAATALIIGVRSGGSTYFNGYMSNVRIVKGQALFTGTFTPSTTSLTNNTVGHTGAGAAVSLTGTVSLLTFQSTSLVDNSVNKFTIVPNIIFKPDFLIVPLTQTYTYNSWSLVSASQTLNYVLATRSDNTLYGWGYNINSSLGFYSPQSLNNFIVQSPTQVSGGGSWTQISAGGGHTLAINSANKLYAWGLNNTGQTTNGSIISWTFVTGTKTGSANAAGFAIRNDGSLWSWGSGSNGQLGQGDTISKSSPVQIGTNSWISVSGGTTTNVFAIRSDNTLWAWGLNSGGSLGLGDTINRSSPVQIGTSSWSAISAGNSFGVGITIDGKLFTWGFNFGGVLGDFSPTIVGGYRSSPVQVGTSSWTKISTATQHIVAINSVGLLYTWGANDFGQLGIGVTTYRSSPVQITSVAGSFTQVHTGTDNTYAIRTDGTLWSCGYGSVGYLGLGDAVSRSNPLQVLSGSSFSQISSGFKNEMVILGITTAGTLFAWGGSPTNGILGINLAPAARSNPTQIGLLSNWSKIGGAFAIDTSGNLYGWGPNSDGSGGDGTVINRSSPTQVGTSVQTILNAPAIIGNSSWTAVSAGGSHSTAIRTDGGLFTWGLNTNGQLGLTDTVSRSSPVQVGTSSWVAVSAGSAHTFANRYGDNLLFTWGFNTQGQLGSGVTTARSSPVQVNSYSTTTTNALTFNGTTQYLSGGSNLPIITTGPFTIEAWVNWNGTGTSPAVCANENWSGGNNAGFYLFLNSTGTISLGAHAGVFNTQPIVYTSTNTVPATAWTHIAMTRDGSDVVRTFINGVVDPTATTITQSLNLQSGTTPVFYIGALLRDGGIQQAFPGSISNLRIVPRNAVYTTTFTPPTSALTATQSAGTNIAAISGIPSNGYSVWFNGSNMYLTIPYNAVFDIPASTAFTFECWVYTASTNVFVMAGRNWNYGGTGPTWAFSLNGGVTPVWNIAGTGSATYIMAQSTLSGTLGQWNHYAFTRDAANLVNIWVNGVSGVSRTDSQAMTNASGAVYIGVSTNLGSAYANGFMSNMRMVKGQALYTGTFTPSTSPLTTTSQSATAANVALLTCQSTTIIDNSTNIFTITNVNAAVVSLAYSPFGTQATILAAQNTTVTQDNSINAYTFTNVATVTSSTVTPFIGPLTGSTNAGASNGMAISSSGLLYAWGLGTSGQVGNGAAVNRSAPVQVGSTTSIIEYSPVQVGSSSWSQVSAGASHAVGIKLDNTVYAWGLNSSGQLGDNSITSRSSPVQVGTVSSNLTNANAYSLRFNGTSQYLTTSAQTSSTYFGTGDFTIETWVNLTATPTKVSGATYSLTFDGSTQYLTLPTSTYIGTSSDYTVEFWCYARSLGSGSAGCMLYTTSGGNYQIVMRLNGSAWEVYYAYATAFATVPTSTVPISQWNHMALVRIGGTVKWYINGTQYGTVSSNTVGATAVQIGMYANLYFDGYISNIRIVNGTGVYTGAFTPPTAPLSTIQNSGTNIQALTGSETKLLTAQNSTIIDNSTNAFTITNNGGVTVSSTTAPPLYDYASLISVNNNWQWGWNDSGSYGFNFMPGFVKTTDVNTGVLTLGVWYHIAVQRVSNTVSAWVNGVNTGINFTDTTNYTSTNAIYIGKNRHPSAIAYFPGLISNLRIIKGQGLFTGVFTPSANPLTTTTVGHTGLGAASSVTGTTILLTAQNTSIVDNSTTGFTLTNTGGVAYALATPFTNTIASGAIFATQISAGGTHSVAIDTQNKLYAWGLNSSGQLGLTDTVNRSAPIQIGFDNKFTSVSAGSEHTIAIDTNNSLYTWGLGTTGQLGLNDVVTRSSPTQVTSMSLTNLSSPIQVGTSSYTAVSAGNNTTTAISSTSKLFVWGLGTSGQLGTGVTFSRSSPVQISTNSYNLVSAGGTHTTFVPNYSPQIILATGLNTSGQLGVIDVISRSSPTQIGASITKFNSPVTASTGNYSSYYVSSPTQVGTSSWTSVSAGGTHTLGVRSNGLLYAWGYNANGQLGGSDTINRSSPVQIGTSSWSQVSAGDSHNVIAKSDGTINTFGLNNFGQLGDGT
jgi:alpha-tubulin suppressor-like RCC1 family protein